VPKVEEMVEVVGLLRGQMVEAASLTKAIQEQKKALAIYSGLDDHAQTVITKKYTITHTNNNLAKKGVAPVVLVVSLFFKDEDEDENDDHHDGDMVFGLQLMSLEGFG
jgi:hypothetical protein